jgi:hypothetical protein
LEPILHLSFPVRDLAASVAFYTEGLGCTVGRRRSGFTDVWFYGMQITLHAQPEQVLPPEQRGVRHFGVTLERTELDAILARLDSHGVAWLDRVSTDHPGTPREQTKAKVLDPDGNAIELKSYGDPAQGFAD